MTLDNQPSNPYLLLTPGPISTTPTVKAMMLRDWCTWDEDYHRIVQSVRRRLVKLIGHPAFEAVLMQGSGTFSVEAAIGTMLPPDGKLLVLANGAYGKRIAEIARRLHIPCGVHDSGELAPPDCARLEAALRADPAISHVAVVHCETTTGMLNPIEAIGPIVKRAGRVFFVDAMSSFGGIPIDVEACGIDVLVSSANKCLQGVPGFGFVLARRDELRQWEGHARSLALDVYEQWRTFEAHGGKWRFTSPTHVVRAFAQALREAEAEGGVAGRYARYSENHRILVDGMRALGFETLLPDSLQAPIITAFRFPAAAGFSFEALYQTLKQAGFVIYPGKITSAPSFRIGNIGDVQPSDMQRLLTAMASAIPGECAGRS